MIFISKDLIGFYDSLISPTWKHKLRRSMLYELSCMPKYLRMVLLHAQSSPTMNEAKCYGFMS